MTLVEFLLARLEEDEQAARDVDGERWVAAIDVGDHVNTAVVTPVDSSKLQPSGWGGPPMIAGDPVVAFCGADYDLGNERAEHIARHDPARVLAEVEAKRAVLGWLAVAVRHADETRRTAPEYRLVTIAEAPRDALLRAVQALAAVYADHPDYDQAWLPSS